jgi:hypothetical protein
MSWARRDEDETPMMEQRELTDRRGRTWIGSVRSGTLEGGEQHAEVIFYCRDQPSELKRVTRVDVPAAEADEWWRSVGPAEAQAILDRSEPA